MITIFNSILTQSLSCNNQDSDIQVGAIGVTFQLIVRSKDGIVDLSSATAKAIYYKKPDDTSGSWVASFTSDGTDGKIEYITTSVNDLNQEGIWQIQGYVSMPDFTGRSTISSFEVNANL